LWLEVVAPAANTASRCPQYCESNADDQQDDSDGPQNRYLQQESRDEQDDSKDDHGAAFLLAQSVR
jgi:hypothetical protein